MSLDLDARQRALLEHMGVRLDFLPPLNERTVAPFEAETPAPQASQTTQTLRAQPSPTRQPSPRPSQNTAQAEPTVAAPTAVPAHPSARADVSQADWAQLQEAVRGCTACGLCQTRKQTVFGVGTAPTSDAPAAQVDLMIVGEAPGENEDLQGEPFVGAAGQLLDQMLAATGLTRAPQGGAQGRVYITNVLKCRPPGNRNPQPDEVAQCSPFLQRQIELVQPKVLLAMGRFGAQALLASQHPDLQGVPLGKLRGQAHRHGATPVVVSYHPAYLLRTPADKAKAWADWCLALSLAQGA
jgi:DNA polymerase